MESQATLFDSDPDWVAFAKKNGYLTEFLQLDNSPIEFDIPTSRKQQAISEGDWARKHPLSSVGYTSYRSGIHVRDRTAVTVKISIPSRLLETPRDSQREKLPVLLVTHGGGWFKGTHITEEAWLLWPLYNHFDLCIVSVEYRLAPEHKFPTWMDDSWDVLEQLLSSPDEFLSKFQTDRTSTFTFSLDIEKLILAGSSAGAGCSAYLSQACRDKHITVFGVILNVPVLCDYRHQPAACTQPQNSYEQCTHAFMSSGIMRAVWDLTIPSLTAGADPKASPLLGNLKDLPKHAIFVAGQDPLRDEGIAYADGLEKAGCSTELFVYKGVPHVFAEFWELEATQRFWTDIRGILKSWLA
jgi:acetyl esterase